MWRVAERLSGSLIQRILDGRELVLGHVRESPLFQDEFLDQAIRVFVFLPY